MSRGGEDNRERENERDLAYLQSTEPLSLIAGDLCINELGKKELSQEASLQDKKTSLYQVATQNLLGLGFIPQSYLQLKIMTDTMYVCWPKNHMILCAITYYFKSRLDCFSLVVFWRETNE